MARTFDAAGLFDQEKYSDITIEFGSPQRKCHKVILCSKSSYFDGLCGPGRKFAESKQPTIKLDGDEEEGVEAMLRWLYTFDYEHRAAQPLPTTRATTPTFGVAGRGPLPETAADFHLNVCVVADKYLLKDLRNEALTRLRKKLEALDETELIRIIAKVNYEDVTYPAAVIDVVSEVRNARISALVKEEGFRTLMRRDNGLCISVVDLFSERPAVKTPALELKTMASCKTCGRSRLYDGPHAVATSGGPCATPLRCTGTLGAPKNVWVEKAA
ncbi:hypothetical protein LTS10_012319 [Elasticomyces elasticus]|nr:hypothetical protein LTS10_012319 [Elasticomyces elasticus]